MMQDLSVTGHKVAMNTYFISATYTNAWVAHHNTDLWRAAAPCNGVDGVWPTGGAWLCQHVWWHYLYTGDTNWLRHERLSADERRGAIFPGLSGQASDLRLDGDLSLLFTGA